MGQQRSGHLQLRDGTRVRARRSELAAEKTIRDGALEIWTKNIAARTKEIATDDGDFVQERMRAGEMAARRQRSAARAAA